jgi:hypothetical protein
MPPASSTVEDVLTHDGGDTLVVLTHHNVASSHIDGHRVGWEHQRGRLRIGAA